MDSLSRIPTLCASGDSHALGYRASITACSPTTMTSGTLEGAHDFVLNNPQLYDHSSHTKIEQVIHGTVGSGELP